MAKLTDKDAPEVEEQKDIFDVVAEKAEREETAVADDSSPL